jgi:DNA/RNA endonuclease YhcR with UshA esterase domain
VLEQQERTALGLLIIVLAILSAGHLILTAVGNAPFAAPMSKNSNEGDLVVVTGIVEGITTTSSGGHLLLSVNGTRVFIPSPASREVTIQVNETVRIYGIVQIYQGKQEVAVRDARDVQKSSPP